MIFSLRGKLIFTDSQTAVVECGGVGYKCAVTLNTLSQLPKKGSDVFLYTHMVVREDAMDLYGFYTTAELDCFKLITSVNGVGPKVGISILSDFTPDQLALFIASGDAKSITRAAGVGAKLAQRIVLELKDKVGASGIGSAEVQAAGNALQTGNAAEAVAALVSLGYSQSESALAVGRSDPLLPVEELIKSALKTLSKQV